MNTVYCILHYIQFNRLLLVMSYPYAYHLSGETVQKKIMCGKIAVINNNLTTDSDIYLNNIFK